MPVSTIGDEPEQEYSLGSARRYYLSKRRAAREMGDLAFAGAWQAKQEAQPGTALAVDFPAKSALAAAGYTTTEDLTGASLAELLNAGLSLSDATAALAALE